MRQLEPWEYYYNYLTKKYKQAGPFFIQQVNGDYYNRTFSVFLGPKQEKLESVYGVME